MNKALATKLHNQSVDLIIDKFIGRGTPAYRSQSLSYDIILGDIRCKVLAHQNRVVYGKYSVIVEYATDAHDLASMDYDVVLYRNILNDGTPDKFYMIPKDTLLNQINMKMKDHNPHYQYVHKDCELTNAACLVAITEAAFARIKGVEIYNL